jgi:hypothetical protein
VAGRRRNPLSRTTEGLPTAQVVGPLFRLVGELADTFRGVFSRDTIERYVDDTYEPLASQATVTAVLFVRVPNIGRDGRVRDLLADLLQH